MAKSERHIAMVEAGARASEHLIATRTRRIAELFYMLAAAVWAGIGLHFMFGPSGPSFALSVAGLGLSVIGGLGLLSVVFTRRRDDTLRKRLQRARRLQRAALGPPSSSLATSGVVVAAADARHLAVLREYDDSSSAFHASHPHITVVAQPFVIETPEDVWLIDTAELEVVGGTPSIDGYDALKAELEMGVGAEVFVLGSALEEVSAPPWYHPKGAKGYRTRPSMRQLVGTADHPIQLWVRRAAST